jgi:hypothetical protein
MGRKKRVVEGDILDLTGDDPVILKVSLVETPVVVVTGTVVDPPPVTKADDVILSTDEICEIIDSMRQTCNRCGADVYCGLRKWGDQKVCTSCYDVVYPPHKKALNDWMESAGLKGCAFCEKPRINPSEFHFDHVNMFEKKNTVGRMLFDGMELDKIVEEIGKCQLLCTDCHAIVTKLEVRLGFTQLKSRRYKRKTGVRKEDYNERMGEVYSLIKARRGGAGSTGAK